MSWVAAIWLVLAPTTWQPQPASPPTVWAEAGSRSWSQCREFERSAERVLAAQSFRSDERGAASPWPDRARLCPGAPAVLVTAAMFEVQQAPGLPALSELAGEVVALAETQRASRRRALEWIAAAEVEANRRGEAPPPMMWTLRARAALGLGEPALARESLRMAAARGELEGWRLDRMAALAALFAGDLERALVLAHRARELGTIADRGLSTMVLALVYDRAGATDAAQRELAGMRSFAYGFERGEIDAYLPMHERVYLLGLEQAALRNPGNATWALKAYLACPEVQAPERTQVERRLTELRPG